MYCSECINMMLSTHHQSSVYSSDDGYSSFTKFVSKGRLTLPSNKVFRIIKTCKKSVNYLIIQNNGVMKRNVKNILLDTAKWELLKQADIPFKHFKHSLSYKSVSYTHLDVYKRQL